MRKRVWLLPLLALLLLGPDWGYVVRTEYRLETADLPEAFSGLRVAVVSDLHGRRLGRNHERLLRALRAAKPDLIAVTGDLWDENHAPETLEGLVRALCAEAPVFYVTGNHEWYAGRTRAGLRLLRSWGVHVLADDYAVLRRGDAVLAVAGVHDPNGPYDKKTPEALTAELRAALGPEVCILMLAHRNGDLTTWADLGVQAVLCGHGHGGLWRLPFLGGLFGPDRSLLPHFDAGVFREGRTAMVVSRGLGNSAPIPRLFNPAELPVVTLIPEKKERD